MKKILFSIFIIASVSFGAIFNIFLTQSANNEILLSISNIQKMAEAELVTVAMKDNRDNPEGCNTTKVVEVSVEVGDGKFETQVKTISVRGLENACKHEDNKNCTAYACYAN